MKNLSKENLKFQLGFDAIDLVASNLFRKNFKTSYNEEEGLFQTQISNYDGKIIFHQNTANEECFEEAFFQIFERHTLTEEIFQIYTSKVFEECV
jgi:EAL domain-containing protein (putative c-di-GMP-specific phosphodiesterase class I)